MGEIEQKWLLASLLYSQQSALIGNKFHNPSVGPSARTLNPCYALILVV